jgi:hypothetical protein
MTWSGHPYELIDFWRPDDGRNRTRFFMKTDQERKKKLFQKPLSILKRRGNKEEGEANLGIRQSNR